LHFSLWKRKQPHGFTEGAHLNFKDKEHKHQS
jgi:hypothetical protein